MNHIGGGVVASNMTELYYQIIGDLRVGIDRGGQLGFDIIDFDTQTFEAKKAIIRVTGSKSNILINPIFIELALVTDNGVMIQLRMGDGFIQIPAYEKIQYIYDSMTFSSSLINSSHLTSISYHIASIVKEQIKRAPLKTVPKKKWFPFSAGCARL